jgi:HAMP domain-containing protein
MSRLSIRTKMMIVFMGLFTVVLAGVFIWFYQYATARALKNMQGNLITAATIAAGTVDPAEHARVQALGVEDTPEYNHIANQLRQVRASNEYFDAVYTFVPSPGNPTEVIFIVDAEQNPDQHMALGEPYDAAGAPQMLKAFEGKPTVDANIIADPSGKDYLSGYAPILDSSGKVIAVVGVDWFGEDVRDLQRNILKASLIAFVLSLAAVFAAVYLLSGAITKPLRLITGAAQSLEQDEPFEPERLEGVAGGADELGQLARVFSRMASQVQDRQKKLKDEVTQLKIEIDEVKRQKQVDEIAGSEFFKDLKDKARAMRDNSEEG